MKDDIISVIKALADQAGAVVDIIQVIAVLVGLWFISEALLRLVKASKGHHGYGQSWGMSSPLVGLCIGSALINFGFTVSTMVQSFFGDQVEYSNIVAYSQQLNYGTGEMQAVIQGLAALVVAFGAYAILEGFFYWKKCADGRSGEDYFRKGLTHILGGAAAVNIVGTINLLSGSMGVNLHNYF